MDEPDKKELLRRIEDLKLRNHLLRDRVDLPDELYAKRMKWYDKAMQVDTLTAERDKYRDACERLISYYGEESNWGCAESYNDQHRCGHSSFCTYTAYQGVEEGGAAFARQVEAEIKGESK